MPSVSVATRVLPGTLYEVSGAYQTYADFTLIFLIVWGVPCAPCASGMMCTILYFFLYSYYCSWELLEPVPCVTTDQIWGDEQIRKQQPQINKPTNQPASQLINQQPTNQTNKTSNQASNQCINNQLIHQSQSSNQPNQALNHQSKIKQPTTPARLKP